MYKGIGASSGIAIGRAFVLPTWEWDFPEELIDVTEMAQEFEKLYNGIRTSKNEIEAIKKEISDIIGAEESTIFDAHLAILEDPIFMNEIQGIIQRQYKAAEVAVKEVIDKFVNMFDLLDDQYMKERALDIKDVGNRLIKHLLGAPEVMLPKDTQPFILVAKELSPSQLVHMNPERVLGFVTMVGGRNSHSAIMARAMGIPFVIGFEEKMGRPVQTGDLIIMDGDDGSVFINPALDIVQLYEKRKDDHLKIKETLQKIVDVPTITLDGQYMSLAVNITSEKELDLALKNGATGVGLFRTEFLYMDRSTLPSEEEQYQVYRQVAEKLADKPLIIRTLDIGGDKQLDYMALPEEDNPFLGYRAIRISLDRVDLFKTQLRAILRASPFGCIKIMYPMISSIEEVRRANEVLQAAMRELAADNVDFNRNIQVGIMIEVPAAAVIADLLAQEVDFFSIGTNDLIQYVLAVDRMNDHIAHMYEPFHPAIIRMLVQTAEAGKRHGINVGVCGEMAGDIRAIPIWLALGVDELSMSVQALLQVKHAILNSNSSQCGELLKQILQCKTNEEINLLLG
jgi:phosphotransferase system enzyme I (PtsI)